MLCCPAADVFHAHFAFLPCQKIAHILFPLTMAGRCRRCQQQRCQGQGCKPRRPKSKAQLGTVLTDFVMCCMACSYMCCAVHIAHTVCCWLHALCAMCGLMYMLFPHTACAVPPHATQNLGAHCRARVRHVYSLKNINNNRRYIGQTVDMKRRYGEHRRCPPRRMKPDAARESLSIPTLKCLCYVSAVAIMQPTRRSIIMFSTLKHSPQGGTI